MIEGGDRKGCGSFEKTNTLNTITIINIGREWSLYDWLNLMHVLRHVAATTQATHIRYSDRIIVRPTKPSLTISAAQE